MSSSIAPTSRLNRFLFFLQQDAGNLTLRKDAVREACDVGEWGTARSLIDAGLQLHPESAELLALSGFAHLQAQSYEDAEHALSSALAYGIDAPKVRYNLAFAHFMRGRHADALGILADPQLPPAVPLALQLRARCLHHLQRPQDAIIDCEARLATAHDDADTHGLLGLLLQEQGRNEAARVHIDTALRHNPQQLEAMLALASVQRDAQDYDAAILSFDTLLRAHPDCGRAWLGLAMIRLTHLQFEAARSDIERAATHMPEHIGTVHVLAWIHLMQGDVVAAELAFDRAMALDRNFGETHGGMAVIAALQGREEEARGSIKRALRLDGQSMSAQYAEMLLLQRAGKHEQARAVFEAFLARPVTGSEMQFRDLVTLHIKYL